MRRKVPGLSWDGETDGIDTIHEEREMTPEQILLSWFQASLPQFHISNFTRDWSDGTKLSALVDYCQPGLIPNWNQKDPSKAAENMQNALSIASEHFAIPEIIHAEDLATPRPDKLSVMTYLSYFCCPGSPGEKVLLEWVATVTPEVQITNFTSNWKDGHALCSLLASFAPSAIDLDALDAHSDVKNTQIGMETAEEQFGIKPLMTAEEFVSPDIDQLSVMAYLTHFRFIRDERRKLPFLSAIGPGVTGAEIGKEVELWIDGEEVEEEYMEVRVTSPDSSLIYVKEVPNHGASPLFIYKPTIAGTYRVEVKYTTEHLKGSPYIVRHTASLDAVTTGRGLHRACVGIEAEFTVDCSTLGKGILSARIVGPDEEPLDVVMGDEEEGMYRVVYTPRATGDHTIDLEWDYTTESEDERKRDREVGEDEGEGEEEPSEAVTTLKASYTVIVFDASKCIVIGDGLSQAFIGEPAYFQVRTGGAGKGSLAATMEGPDNPKVKLLMVTDSEYSYEYVPGEASYLFELKWENFPIPGSPFKVTPTAKTAASRCVVKNRPADHVQVYKPVSAIVSVVDAEGSELMARVTGPNTNKDCSVTEIETGIYAITICPTEVGEYCIHITLDTGCKIPKSPLRFDVYDPSKCQVMNTDALVSNSWQCGRQVLVRVSTERAGKGTVEGEVEGPTQSDVCRTVEEGGGYTLLCFTPTETGQHTLNPTFEGHRFEEAIKIFVVDDSLEGIAITKPVSHTGYHPAGKDICIRMFAPGRDAGLFTVKATGSQTGAALNCSLVPTGEDTYTITLIAPQPDDYRVTIVYHTRNIPGSPFTLSVRTPPRPEKIVSFDQVLPLTAGENPIELFFDVSAAGAGIMTANVTDSSSEDWFQLVDIKEVYQDIFSISFVPPNNDSYVIRVFWSGKPVLGSPFRIDYHEAAIKPPVCIDFESDLSLKTRVSVTVIGSNTERVETEIRQYERGRYRISFVPGYRDIFKLHISNFDREIRGSPFVVNLSPSPPKKLPAGVHVVSLPITIQNQPGIFSAFAIGQTVGLVQCLTPSISHDKKLVHIEFADRQSERYEVYIFWNQLLLPGSPFVVDVRT